jgi:alpha-tubulin suppressor-like RCC1 family protein
MPMYFSITERRGRPKRNAAVLATGLGAYKIAIQKNGRAWGWGNNNTGQMGDNSTICRATPVSVGGLTKTFCKIGIGYSHAVAIAYTGRAWSWGVNTYGQLGDNSVTQRFTPVAVLGAAKTFCQIAAGSAHGAALDQYGRVWCWGYNTYGQLGDNTSISKRTPVSILGAVKTFCTISSGDSHILAIDKNGRAWGWGFNLFGTLGDNSVTNRATPVSVLGAVKTFCQISGGGIHNLAIDKNGRAWGWGYNYYGQIGNNSATSQRTPVSVLGVVKTFCQISAGTYHSLAIDKNGRAWGWGYNSQGQLGDNSVSWRATPVSVAGTVKTFCQISAGDYHSVAIDKNGSTWAWGDSASGQIGNGTLGNSFTFPVSTKGNTKTFCKITAGIGNNIFSDFSVAIDKNGRAWGWGYNNYGQLGDNSTTLRYTPVSVLGAVKTFCQISAGGSHILSIDKNGRLWSWGYNASGQLGDNSTTSRLTPVSVLGAVKTFCTICGGTNHSLSIDKNGRVWSWGLNTSGQLGDNSTTSRLTPVSVLGGVKTFCTIAAGFTHTLGIDKNGRVWGWGSNGNSQLGDNTTTQRNTPVSVLGAVKTFCQISGGILFSLGIDKNGRAWGWGGNGNGQLGDNSVTQRATPVSVAGTVKTFCKISAGNNFSAAIDKNGRVWAWGINTSGQLGNGTNISQRTPVSVIGAVKTFCEIAVAANHTIAIDKNGLVWGWGNNSNGPLGFEYFTRTPIRVCNI